MEQLFCHTLNVRQEKKPKIVLEEVEFYLEIWQAWLNSELSP